MTSDFGFPRDASGLLELACNPNYPRRLQSAAGEILFRGERIGIPYAWAHCPDVIDAKTMAPREPLAEPTPAILPGTLPFALCAASINRSLNIVHITPVLALLDGKSRETIAETVQAHASSMRHWLHPTEPKNGKPGQLSLIGEQVQASVEQALSNCLRQAMAADSLHHLWPKFRPGWEVRPFFRLEVIAVVGHASPMPVAAGPATTYSANWSVHWYATPVGVPFGNPASALSASQVEKLGGWSSYAPMPPAVNSFKPH